MNIITTTPELAEFCAQAAQHSYVTVDTEFLRERTYYPKLCLIQLAMPGTDDNSAVLVDPLSDGLDLDPLYALFRDENVVKVFHAARQDLEIFYLATGTFPKPFFDTQVAAMVCGFGEQAGYETLVRKIAHTSLDKSSRFTDWSRRPLSAAQQSYALADVTHLRVIYEQLSKQLAQSGRAEWVQEELGVLLSPDTYVIEPREAWRRIKTRAGGGKFLATLRELAAFREELAQSRNIPRGRIFKDDALSELAASRPATLQDLGRSRLLLREARKGDVAQGILDAINRAQSDDTSDLKARKTGRENMQVNAAIADLLRVLLKAKAEQEGVAAKLIASTSDLDAMAAGLRDVPALSGWRLAAFGNDALRVCSGEVALAIRGADIEIVEL